MSTPGMSNELTAKLTANEKVPLTAALRKEYETMFDNCIVNNDRQDDLKPIIHRINSHKILYAEVASAIKCPWYLIAAIHSLESSLSFARHLHNGDPLTKRTRQVPAGRPLKGEAPFSWEESATDALQLKGIHNWKDWSIGGLLWQLERYNGWGYRLYHKTVKSPYLWSFTNQYKGGKYVADGKFSLTAQSQQCGAVAIIKKLLHT